MRKKGLLLALSSVLLVSGLTSCGFFGSDEYALSSYDTSYDEVTGETLITFYFTDEDKDPFVVTIPAGQAGKDGTSITSATLTDNEDNHSYTITIKFSDDSVAPLVMTIPYYEGVSVTGVTVDHDKDGNTVLQFTYSDGTYSQNITIPRGNGIASITATPTTDGYHIVVSFTDEGVEPVELDLTNGISITSVSVDDNKQTTEQYCLTITYSNGTSEDVFFDRPQATKWLYGASTPNDIIAPNAKDGDYFVNISTGWVYVKNNGTWTPLFCMKAEEDTTKTPCSIMFDPNGGHWSGTTNTNAIISTAHVGETMALANIQIPVYDGYVFKGWFTDPTNPNSGQFTDLTIIPGNLTLLAKWEVAA